MHKPLNSVSIGEAFEILKNMGISAIMNNRIPRNVYIAGSMGLGKSTIVYGLKNEILSMGKFTEVEVIDRRLTTIDDSSSLMGIPFIPSEKKEETDMFFSTPSWFPEDNPTKFYILFLDELPNSHPSIQQAAYQLVLDRCITNGKKLPDNVWIIAAGNLKSDNTGARDLLPALANRFSIHLQIDKDRCVDDFITYAYAKKLNQTIISFISYKRDALNPPYTGESAFATSRSWEMLHDNLIDTIGLPKHLLLPVVAGTIGSALATEFVTFMEFESILPNWNAIRGGESYILPSGIAERYYIMTSLAKELSDAMTNRESEYVSILSDMIVGELQLDHKVVLFKMIKAIGLNNIFNIVSHPKLLKHYKLVSDKVK